MRVDESSIWEMSYALQSGDHMVLSVYSQHLGPPHVLSADQEGEAAVMPGFLASKASDG